MAQAGHGRLYGVLESRGGGTRPCGSPGSTESADAGTLRPIRSSSVSRARNGKTSSAAGASASVSFVPPSTSQCPGTANFGSKVNSSCKTWAPSPVRSPPGCSTRDKGVRKSGSGSAAISSSTDGRWNLYGVWDRHQQVDDGKLLGGPLIGGSVMPLLARGLDGIAMGRVGVGASAWIGVGGLDGKKNNVQKGAPLLHRRKMEKQTQLKGCSSGTDASVASDQRIANWKPYGMPSPNRTSPRGGSGSIGKSNSAANSEQTTNSEKGGQLHRDLVLAPQGHRRAKSDVFGVGLSPVNGVCKPVSNEALNMGGAESLLPYVRPRPEVPESQASMGRVCGAKGSLTEEEVNDCSLSARRAGGQGVSLCAPAAANCQGETVRIELVGIRSLDSDARKPNGQQSRAQAIIHSVETPILRAQSADGNPPAAMGGAHGSSAMLVNVYPVSGKGGKPLQDFSSEVLDASGDWNAPVANEANGLFVSAVLASTGEQPSAREAEMPAGTEGDESDIRSGMVVDAPASYQESSQECVEQVVVRSLSEGGSRLMADLLSRGTEDSEVKQAIERNPGKTPELEQEKRKEGPLEVTPETLWKELEPYIRYLSKQQLSIVHDALKLAFDAHDGQKRKSGEPYIIHPVAVAQILGGLEMDCETIVAGLLHDTVEDTMLVTFEGIEDQFGTVVRRIVEGETKVSKMGKMHTQNSCDVKADDLRQMFLAMTEEVRVIIVKLADRLHNMRTLSHMPSRKQKHIAEETLQVFAPLAKLLGMYQVKSELEDLAFMYAYPEEYAEVRWRIDALSRSQADVVLEAKNVLLGAIKKDKFLDLTTVDAHVVTICKEPYSIFKKLQRRKCLVQEVSDITQLRIVLKMKPAVDDVCNAQQVCYHVLGIIHAMWPPVPGTVKDYIATPKPNGYQSLHTTILPLGSKMLFPLEIQIRTEEMDKLAEWGIAANHSQTGISASQIGYSRVGEHRDQQAEEAREDISPSLPENKDMIPGTGDIGMLVNRGAKPRGIGIVGADGTFLNDVDIARRVSWLNSIREWQEEFVGNMTAREFVDTIMGDLLGSRVFVFTPEGEVKNLPKGATVIDYAYLIHTDVGNKMIAAKVNGNIVSPTRTLCNAEVVDIIIYDGPISKKSFQLHQQWLKFARTRSARYKLTKFLKEHAAMAASEITAEAVDRFVNGVAAINYIDAGDKPIAMSGEMLDRLSPEASTSYWTSPSWETRRSSKKGPEIGVDGEMVMVSGAEKISGGKYSTNYPSNMEASTSSLGTSLYEEVLTDTVGGKEIGKSLDSGSKGVTVGDGAMRGGNAGGGGGGGGGGGVRKLGQRVVEMTGPWSLSPSSPSSSRSLSPSSSRSLSPSRSSSPSRTTPPSRSKPPSFKFMRRATCTTEGGVHEQLTKSLLGPRNPGDGEARGGLDGYTDADSSRARLENILENGCKNEGDGNGISGDKGKEMGTKLFGTKDKLDSHGQSVSELPTDEKGNPGVVNMTREMGFVGDNQLDVASLAVLKVFDAWEMQIVSTWHAEKGRTIVWMSVHYVDRKGLLADVSAIFSKHGIGIQTFSGRTDQKTRVGVMLFELDGPSDMGDICAQVETVPDVLSWVMGCTWQYPNYLLSKNRAAGT